MKSKRRAVRAAQRTFVEEMGSIAERSGSPKVPGRIMGYLLVCDPPEQTAAEIERALGASAGSVSTWTRRLEGLGVLERVAVSGSRRMHFRLRPNPWMEMMRSRLQWVTAFRDLAERGLRSVPAGSDAARRLDEMREFYAFMERELPALFDRWQAGREARPTML